MHEKNSLNLSIFLGGRCCFEIANYFTPMKNHTTTSRRKFMKSTAALGSLSLFPNAIHAFPNMTPNQVPPTIESQKSIIGSYGAWANKLTQNPARLSFLLDHWNNLESWRKEAMNKTRELVSPPDIKSMPKVKTKNMSLKTLKCSN